MGKKSELFDKVLAGPSGRTTALGKTDAYGTRRLAELSEAESIATERARQEHRVIVLVDPSDIEVDPLLRDRNLEAARRDPEFAELVEDVRAVGIKTPLVVRLKPEGGLALVEGSRRLAAALELGLPQVPVIERPYKNDEAATEDMLRENLVRHNPPPLETALLFARLVEKGWTDERISGLLRAKAWTISRIRTVARGFMPWLADACPDYRNLPFVEMVKLAPVVEQNPDRRSLIIQALGELSGRDGVEPKAVVEAIRTIAMTGAWSGHAHADVSSSAPATTQRPRPRMAFDASGSKVALLTHHEGQMVIRFTKRVPDAVIERVWSQIEDLVRSSTTTDSGDLGSGNPD